MTGKRDMDSDTPTSAKLDSPSGAEPASPPPPHVGQGDGQKADPDMPHLSEGPSAEEVEREERIKREREIDAKLAKKRQERDEESKKPVVREKQFGVLSPDEETLLKLSQEGKLAEIKELLVKNRKVKIDCLDDSGTTPLEHACYKGNKELVEFFLNRGADVNNNMQTQGYTPLMFAALAGKQEIVRTVLRHGARTSATNGIGRTASQLAGFVGHHAIAITISNFFTVEELDYFTKLNGLEKEPKLPPKIAPIVHRFLMVNNLHPVKIIHFLRDHPVIMEHSTKVLRTFDTIIEKQIKSKEMNEIMAMKVHYLACVMRYYKKMIDDGKTTDDMIKLFVRGRDAKGFQDYMDKFIRESIRSFPYYQTPLHTTMIHAIAKANLGGNSGSISILEQSINGQHMSGRDGPPCDTCSDPEAKKKCSACHMVAYCQEECQKMHWPVHKRECKELAEQFVLMEKRRVEEEEKTRLEEEEAKRKKEQEETGNVLAIEAESHQIDDEEKTLTNEEEPAPEKPDALKPALEPENEKGDSNQRGHEDVVQVEDVKVSVKHDEPEQEAEEDDQTQSNKDTEPLVSGDSSKPKGKGKSKGKKKKNSPAKVT